MKSSPENSPEAARTRRVALLSAPPLLALALAAYAFSGAHMKADAGAKPVSTAAAPSTAVEATSRADPTSTEESPVMPPQDAELLAYRPYGG